MAKKEDFKKQIYGNPNWINGRINRAEYFWRTFLTGLTYGILVFIAWWLYFIGLTIPAILVAILAAWMYWRIVMAYVKRLHDLGWSGWFSICLVLYQLEENFFKSQVLYLIFILFTLVLSLYLLFRKGDDGANKYGKDPLMKYEENK